MEPKLGAYGVVRTGGFFGKLIRLGTLSHWNHAVVYIGDELMIEANIVGVQVSPVTKYRLIAWNQHETLTALQRRRIVKAAHEHVGQSYGFADIVLISTRILGIRLLSHSRLLNRLAQRNGVICSELVALCYHAAGITLVDKPSYLVTPALLAERLIYQ